MSNELKFGAYHLAFMLSSNVSGFQLCKGNRGDERCWKARIYCFTTKVCLCWPSVHIYDHTFNALTKIVLVLLVGKVVVFQGELPHTGALQGLLFKIT